MDMACFLCEGICQDVPLHACMGIFPDKIHGFSLQLTFYYRIHVCMQRILSNLVTVGVIQKWDGFFGICGDWDQIEPINTVICSR